MITQCLLSSQQKVKDYIQQTDLQRNPDKFSIIDNTYDDANDEYDKDGDNDNDWKWVPKHLPIFDDQLPDNPQDILATCLFVCLFIFCLLFFVLFFVFLFV